MKKPIIAFLVVFAIAFGIFASAGIHKVNNNLAISKAPVFVLGNPDGITERTKKSRKSYQVNYTYDAGGTTYKLDTDWMDTKEAAMAMADTPVQIAYATATPGDAVFKSEFDARDPNEGIMSALLKAAGIALLAAFGITLVLLWKFPRLRP